MEVLSKIKHHLSSEVLLFDGKFSAALESGNPLLQSAVSHFLTRSGKRIRPLLVMLAARLCAQAVTEQTLNGAVALELLHSASLIHDDVLDDSLERRGAPSMNALYNNKMSILIGDYFLSASLISAVSTQNPQVLEAISSLSRSLTEGEIEQLSLARLGCLDQEAYFSVIGRKTASLFSTCLKVGALSVEATGRKVECLVAFGRLFGLCFQIQDDIFDYFSSAAIGKPTGNDIREGKITLPLLYALRNASPQEQEPLLQLLKRGDLLPDEVERLVMFAKQNGGIEYARLKMDELSRQAVAALDYFDDCAEKQLLLSALDYLLKRDC